MKSTAFAKCLKLVNKHVYMSAFSIIKNHVSQCTHKNFISKQSKNKINDSIYNSIKENKILKRYI